MILIRNADLYNPQHIGLRDILVAGGQVVAIGEGLDDFPVDVERIDAAGGIVHPGFIDGHVHAIGGGGEAGMISRVPPLSEGEIAQAAVTGIVGVLGTDGRTRTVRDLLAKIKGYREWGLSAWALTGSYELPSQTITGSVGDDIALIEEIIGVKVAISDHRCSIPTTEELTRLAGEARVAGPCGQLPHSDRPALPDRHGHAAACQLLLPDPHGRPSGGGRILARDRRTCGHHML